MSKILAPSRGPSDWQSLLVDPAKHWRAGFSAMAAARAWEAAKGLPPEFEPILGPGAELILAIPEHKVPLPGGRRDSQCDVFALVRSNCRVVALAVEAKVNETFDKTMVIGSPRLLRASAGALTPSARYLDAASRRPTFGISFSTAPPLRSWRPSA